MSGATGNLGVHLPEARDRALHVPRPPVRVRRARLDGHVRRGRGNIMSEVTRAQRDAARPRPPVSGASLLWVVLPLLALVLSTVWLVGSDGLRAFDTGAPPVEKLTFERTILDGDGIHVTVRAGGSEPVTIAQVQVDDAYWTFRQEPPGPPRRLPAAPPHPPPPRGAGGKQEGQGGRQNGKTL